MRTYCFSLDWHRIVLKGFAILFLTPLSGLAQTPSLLVEPISLGFFHQLPAAGIPEEGPASKTLTVEASNSAALNFTATASVTTPAGVNWLFVNGGSQTSGTTPGTLTVSVNVIGLAHNNTSPSPYIGTITISADGVSNSPLTVQVILRISGDRQLAVSQNVLQFDATGGEEETLSQGLTLFTVGFHPGPLLYTTTVITQDGGAGWRCRLQQGPALSIRNFKKRYCPEAIFHELPRRNVNFGFLSGCERFDDTAHRGSGDFARNHPPDGFGSEGGELVG